MYGCYSIALVSFLPSSFLFSEERVMPFALPSHCNSVKKMFYITKRWAYVAIYDNIAYGGREVLGMCDMEMWNELKLSSSASRALPFLLAIMATIHLPQNTTSTLHNASSTASPFTTNGQPLTNDFTTILPTTNSTVNPIAAVAVHYWNDLLDKIPCKSKESRISSQDELGSRF